MPAVLLAIPARQASRACRLGNISRSAPLSFFARPKIIDSSVPRQNVQGSSTMQDHVMHLQLLPAGQMRKPASNLQIDSGRLWGTIHETAKFGLTAKGGVRRLTLGPEDKQVRDWFRTACEAAGLEVHVDGLGSMFALRKGRDMSKLPVGLGSHLDTQPTGGKFDGVLGTLAALEVVRTLNDAGIETETPICIVNWTNEEGSRFAPATMASAAYAGDYTTENMLARRDGAWTEAGRHRWRGRDCRSLPQRHPRGDCLHRRYAQPGVGNARCDRQGFARRGCGNRRQAQGRDRARCDLAQGTDGVQPKTGR